MQDNDGDTPMHLLSTSAIEDKTVTQDLPGLMKVVLLLLFLSWHALCLIPMQATLLGREGLVSIVCACVGFSVYFLVN